MFLRYYFLCYFGDSLLGLSFNLSPSL
ncbi:unnamed protein product [Kuraishia capsulata CBS 1993]|uniref:Uncharacterized protein n=1 Tax=Kuraishia capsulata CBS 1993 TaxID=1382522 RepID=W6MM82_9ASCO|nr:unnamed protein product [Kuraishia capsulata CBS 1993]